MRLAMQAKKKKKKKGISKVELQKANGFVEDIHVIKNCEERQW